MGCYSYSVSSKVREEIMEIYSLSATIVHNACGNYRNLHMHIFDKNFVKVTFLLKKK